jgi:hypothetical protein
MRWAMPTAWPPAAADRRRAHAVRGGLPGVRGRLPAAPRRNGAQGLRRQLRQPGDADAQAGADPARRARRAGRRRPHRAEQTERVRKMLLAFSRDLRVVLLRLASRLQTLRWFAAHKRACPQDLATESLQVFAPLANRLGIWQIKWEIEDYVVPLPAPAEYQRMARLVDETRAARELSVATARPTGRAAGRCRPACRRAGPAQAPVQHLEEDAGQEAWPLRTSSTPARCVWWWTTWPPATPRWPGCTKPGARWKASSTTTSRAPNPTATRACTPWCWARRPAAGSADPHPRHARARRTRRGRALDVQGSRRARLCRRQCQRRIRRPHRRSAQGRAA